jgi:hypothetical protein
MPNHARPRPTEDAFSGVAVLRWPDQDEERRRLAALGRPRVLLTAADVVPPSLLDDREVWIPDGSDAAAVFEAMERLDRLAALAPGRPLIDPDGLLRHAGNWVEIPRAQLGVVAVLVQHYQRLVSNQAVREAYAQASGSTSTSSLNGLVQRLNTRLAKVGLTLHRVHRRGVILGPTSDTGERAPRDRHGPPVGYPIDNPAGTART